MNPRQSRPKVPEAILGMANDFARVAVASLARRRRQRSSAFLSRQRSRYLRSGRVEQGRKFSEAIDVMRGAENINIGQHGANSLSSGFKFLVAKQWIQPDELTAGLRQSLHLLAEFWAFPPIKPISQQNNHCSLTQHSTGPVLVELLETEADPGPS